MGHHLAPDTRAALEELAATDDDPEAAPLARLRAIRSLLLQLETDAATLAGVRGALADGAGWEQVAEAARLKPAAAKWRWQGADEEIASRQDAGRKRSARPSSVPTDLPGLSVAEAAVRLGVTAQAIYLQVKRGTLQSRTVELPDGRSYKRVFPGDGESNGGSAGDAAILDRAEAAQDTAAQDTAAQDTAATANHSDSNPYTPGA